MQETDLTSITIDRLSIPLFHEKRMEASILRLDKIHPQISGNKWFKLRYYIDEAKHQAKKTIVTFGGAWSNHILATAAACRLYGLKSIGIIRGEKPATLSQTLLQAQTLGMELVFISREAYRQRSVPLALKKEDYYFIPEGGYGFQGAAGAGTILDHVRKEDYSHICCAAGTGTMMAGLIRTSLPSQQLTGISVLKNNMDLEKEIRSLLPVRERKFDLRHDYHFGGYAKHDDRLIQFMNEYYSLTNIPSDFVYTGKLLFAVNDLARNNYFSAGSSILIIHSGGLQGNDSLKKGTLIF